MKDLLERAKNVKAVGLDVDGVFFDSRVFIGQDGKLNLKARSFYDGAGILMLMASGIHVAFITREKSTFIQGQAERFNGIISRSKNKSAALELVTEVTNEGKASALAKWIKSLRLGLSDSAYMGDDIFDYDALKYVADGGGFAAAPQQAEEIVKKIVHYVTPRRGGGGAIRDLVNLILAAKNVDPLKLDIPT